MSSTLHKLAECPRPRAQQVPNVKRLGKTQRFGAERPSLRPGTGALRHLWLRLAIIVSIFFIIPAASAAVRTWDGGGTNTFWNNPTNWVGDVAPVAGDDLFFPGLTPNLVNVNNFPNGTTFNSLIFGGGGYSLSGNSIALNAGILATNGAGNFVGNSLILNSNQTFTIQPGSTSFTLLGAIDNNGKDLTFAGNVSGTLVQVQSVISGSGGLIKTGNVSVLMYQSNSFSGPVQLSQGSMTIYNGYALGAASAGTTIASNATLILASSITVPEPLVLSGTLYGAGLGQVLTGPLTLADTNAVLRVASGYSLSVNSVISGAGFTKTFPGILTLNSNNTYTGTTIVNEGILLVNGSQPASPIVLNSGALGGIGWVGTITATGAGLVNLLPPGTSGVLICSNVALGSTTTFQVQLDGTAPGSGYDRLNVDGSVALNNALLNVMLGFTPDVGTSFLIIANDGTDPITGTFSGLPEGSILNVSGLAFRLSYVGGSGNDVTLTRISPPTRIQSITRLANAQIQLQATGGLSGFSYAIQATTNLAPAIQWSNLGTALADSGGHVSFTDTNAGLFPRRFYRAVSP